MQLDTDTVERMAREYNQSLAGYNITDSSSALIERIILFSQDQLDLINFMLCYPQSRHCSKVLNYLKTLVTSSIIALNKVLDRGEYTPPFRNADRTMGYYPSFTKLVDIQIDKFVLLDKLVQIKENIINVLILENRIMAVISVICR